MGKTDSDRDRAKQLVESGSAIAGAASGAALGLFGGPTGVVIGAAAGAALADVVKHVGAGMVQRVLGPREEMRIGAALAFAADAIRDRLNRGETPRDDDFLDAGESVRSTAEEILEGVLLNAKDAYEERKLRALGNLFAGLAFTPEVSRSEANHLLSLAGRLTYRQFCILGVAQLQAARGALMRSGDYRQDESAYDALSSDGIALLTEIYDLGQLQLLTSASDLAWLYIGDIEPGAIRPFGAGIVMTKLMALDRLPQEDLDSVIERLRA